MVAIIVSAVLVCAGALILGQALLRICGFERWSWLAAPVGLAVEILVAVPALFLPGRATTTAAALALLVLAGAVWVLRDAAMRPPIGGLLAAGPVALLTLVPFASAGRAGTLGVSFNNDMASHLVWGEGYRSAAVYDVVPVSPDYPLGPHALVAAVAQGLGVEVDAAFAGLTAATVVLLAWTALGMLGPRVRWPGQVLVATVVGMPYLVAGYYGQGSFKELMQTLFVLGVAVALVQRAARPGPLRWVPLALIVAGALSVYGVLGLPWVVGVLGAALVVAAFRKAVNAWPGAALADVRAGLVPAAAAVAVLVAVIAPQIGRLRAFVSNTISTNGTGIAVDDLGNLPGPLQVWQAFGVWDSGDYRLAAVDQFATGMWTALVLALVVVGVLWCIRRGDWVAPIAALVAFAIWAVSDRTQSPYVAAKALVILTPLLLLLAIRPLVENHGSLPRSWRWVAPVVALVLVVKVVHSSLLTLRYSSVGPTDHLRELRSLRPLLAGKPTLFLGNDDFITWELAGVPVEAPMIGIPHVPFNPAKPWVYGQAIDIDSVEADAINARDWVITTRDAAGSEMPPQLKRVRQTRSYALWRRTGTVQPRSVLPESGAGGAVLNCASRTGRRIVRGGGVAFIRPASRGVAVAPFAAGTSIGVDLPLPPGTYDLSMPYVSAQPIELQVVGHLKTQMPANLDRPGPRWPIGRVTIRASEKRLVRIGMYAHKRRLTPASVVVNPTSIVATLVGAKREVPIREACGKVVDWYKPAKSM